MKCFFVPSTLQLLVQSVSHMLAQGGTGERAMRERCDTAEGTSRPNTLPTATIARTLSARRAASLAEAPSQGSHTSVMKGAEQRVTRPAALLP